jgi:hypothetical protein
VTADSGQLWGLQLTDRGVAGARTGAERETFTSLARSARVLARTATEKNDDARCERLPYDLNPCPLKRQAVLTVADVRFRIGYLRSALRRPGIAPALQDGVACDEMAMMAILRS